MVIEEPTPAAERPKKPRKGPPLNQREQMARAELVLAKRLERRPIAEVCADLNISQATYYRALSVARKSDLYDRARDFLLQDLLPRALRVYAVALEANDIEVARDVINGLGLLGKHTSVSVGPVAEGDSVTFERWRMQRGPVAASGGDVIEANATVYQGGVEEAAQATDEGQPDDQGGRPALAPAAGTRVPEGGVDGEGL